MTIRLDPDTKKRLDHLAETTRRSKSFLAGEAIRDYVALNEWQIAEIEAALKEADRGDFAPGREVTKVFRRWSTDAD